MHLLEGFCHSQQYRFPQNVCKTGVSIIEEVPQFKKVRLGHKFKSVNLKKNFSGELICGP